VERQPLPVLDDRRGGPARAWRLHRRGAALQRAARHRSFTFAALLALRYIEELQGNARKAGKGDIYQLRVKKLQDEFGQYESQVNTAMEAVGSPPRATSSIRHGEARGRATRVAELEVQFSELQVDPTTPTCRAHRRVAAEAEASTSGCSTRAAAPAMRAASKRFRGARRAEQILERAKNPEDAFGLATNPAECTKIRPAADVLAVRPLPARHAAMWGQLRDRTVQYLTALADRRYHGAEVDKDGPRVRSRAGRKVPVTELVGKDLDLWYLSLRLTLAEKFSARARIPVVWKTGSPASSNDAKLPLLNRMLKHLGTLTRWCTWWARAPRVQADEGQLRV